MRAASCALFIAVCLPYLLVSAVKSSDFKRCEQSGFCVRNRHLASQPPQDSNQQVELLPDSVEHAESVLSAKLLLNQQVKLKLDIIFFRDGICRVLIDELAPLRPRYRVPDVVMLDAESQLGSKDRYQYTQHSSDGLMIKWGHDGESSVLINFKPFTLQFYRSGELVMAVNKKNWFNFEHLRDRPLQAALALPPLAENAEEHSEESFSADEQPKENSQPSVEDKSQAGLWEETFNGHADSKPRGPSSIGLDVTFVHSSHLFGIPEHADSFVLKETRGPSAKHTEPYRLYNLDVFEYELDTNVALYGSIPFIWSQRSPELLAKSSASTKAPVSSGLLWLNAAETWVDIMKEKTSSELFFQNSGSSSDAPSIVSHWMSESGIMDFFVMLGPAPTDVSRQYARVTGAQNLPQLFSLGYHQCRWNYMDTMDVKQVHDGFEVNEIPMDVLWLDIEHTDEKKYFTWHSKKFEDPTAMQIELAKLGRKMVTIIDPHIKRDDGYFVKSQASQQGLFVRNKDGGEFDGWCWPGSSSWIDFTSPEARRFWQRLYDHEAYKGSTETLFTWNDMNEPSVFNGPEITMPKDNLHWGDWEHRDVHNIYGMYLHRATYGGHIFRSLPNRKPPLLPDQWLNRTGLLDGPNPHRPFVLSRAFFAGTQRYGPIWTGDNMAKWDHLAASVPMLLSISIAGLGFCGADVGGFFLNPSPELLTRWYQAGVFYPFFRGHAHLDTKRREPWIFGEPYTGYIRDAIRLRYQFLPYWYTLFRQGQVDGRVPMRPLFYEFPADSRALTIEDQFMVGSALMVKPFTKQLEDTENSGDSMDRSMKIYLPGNHPWFNYHTHLAYSPKSFWSGNREQVLPVVALSAPAAALIRGGSVLPLRLRQRRSSHSTHFDPLTLLVALDEKLSASGEYYLDDYESFSYALKGEFVHKIVSVSGTASSLSITVSNHIYNSSRMENWQRPFLGDAVLEANGAVFGYDDIENSMNFKSAESYQEAIAKRVRVERLVILSAASSAFDRLADSSEKVVAEITTDAGDRKQKQSKSGIVSVETVVSSQLYGEEIAEKTDGVLKTYRLIVKDPGVGVGNDWSITLRW